MDPITQGAIASALSVSTRRSSQTLIAGAAGFLAGMAADLDVLIRSSTDSLLFLEYHRQFSHALPFVPIGGLIVAALLYVAARRWLTLPFTRLWLFCSLGYATHGLLDAATSYGTMLFWPFSDTRYSFSIISIVDPLFSLPLLVLLAVGIIRSDGRWARAGLVWAALYLGFGGYQHVAARAAAQDLAASRGHVPLRIEVKPTFANLIVWKSIYETEDRFYTDGIRPTFGATTFEGTSIARFDERTSFPWLAADSQQAHDIDRFTRFSDGYVAAAPDGSERLVDVRYSFLPTKIAPLWSVRLDPDAPADQHVRFETHRGNARDEFTSLLDLIWSR